MLPPASPLASSSLLEIQVDLLASTQRSKLRVWNTELQTASHACLNTADTACLLSIIKSVFLKNVAFLTKAYSTYSQKLLSPKVLERGVADAKGVPGPSSESGPHPLRHTVPQ